jgi:hypothetical protein
MQEMANINLEKEIEVAEAKRSIEREMEKVKDKFAPG